MLVEIDAITARLEELEANEQTLRDIVDEGAARLEAAEKVLRNLLHATEYIAARCGVNASWHPAVVDARNHLTSPRLPTEPKP